MAELTLNNPKETLTINYGEETFEIPLASSLTVKETKKLSETKDSMEFYAKYIPMEVLDEMTMGDFKQIDEAWTAESERVLGFKLGE